MRYFTSDLHIGDKPIARWRGFVDMASHDETILGRLEEALGVEDELWLLGDVGKANVATLRKLRERIPCAKVYVVLGNHDVRSKYESAGGFARVEYYDQVGKVAREGYKFVMSHYPMLEWDRMMEGSYMLHGHIHSLPASPFYPPRCNESAR